MTDHTQAPSNTQLRLSEERIAKLIELTSGSNDGSMWADTRLALMELSNRRAADKLKPAHEPEATPYAWTKVIDSAYDMHPRDVFVEGPHRPKDGTGWEPLFQRPSQPPHDALARVTTIADRILGAAKESTEKANNVLVHRLYIGELAAWRRSQSHLTKPGEHP